MRHNNNMSTLPETLTDRLPEVRVSRAMRQELDQVVKSGQLSGRVSDHVRMAIRLYLQGIDRSQSSDGIFYQLGNK